jgi:hypothetical protein
MRGTVMGSTARKLEIDESVGWVSGMPAKGEFRCAACGYGVTVYRELPACPMCRGERWERVPWRPYSRSYRSNRT